MSLYYIKRNIKTDKNGCWNWRLSCSSSGYGQFTKNGRYWNTHVYVYQYFKGKIPKGNHVRHSCHNRKCCNPRHLSIGTAKDNYNDSLKVHRSADSKRRKSWKIGERTYSTSREAVKSTGISMNSIIKFTKNGVFDIKQYRRACITANHKPKI